MKKSFILLAFIMLLTTFIGCADKVYYEYENQINEYYEGSVLFSHFEKIKRDEFVWNPIYERFEFIIDNDKIDQYMYDNGAVSATVFIYEENDQGGVYETQKTLSFKRKFEFDDSKGVLRNFEETISADISVGALGFFIEGIPLSEKHVLQDEYEFKVSIVWTKESKKQASARVPF